MANLWQDAGGVDCLAEKQHFTNKIMKINQSFIGFFMQCGIHIVVQTLKKGSIGETF
jgi:hypothetical protein